MPSKTFTIISQEIGPEKRSVSLTLGDDGSIQMFTSDSGQTALQTWGKEDYDFWVTIPPDAVSLLALELLRERFTGRVGATDELRDFCKASGIACEWQSYP